MARLLTAAAPAKLEATPMAVGLFIAVIAMVALCAKHARRVSRKLSQAEPSSSRIAPKSAPGSPKRLGTPKSPLPSPKKLLSTISNKTKTLASFNQRKNKDDGAEEEFDGFGDGGLWQKEILMGEKCQPLEFSGVILYDYDGRRVPQFPPRSPRGASLQSSFSFPVVISERGEK